jgi:hypothetical protein
MIADGNRPASLSDLLTVHGHPKACWNVNTAHPELLMGWQTGRHTAGQARTVSANENRPTGQTPQEAAEALAPSEDAVKQSFTVSSNCFPNPGRRQCRGERWFVSRHLLAATLGTLAQVGVGGGFQRGETRVWKFFACSTGG